MAGRIPVSCGWTNRTKHDGKGAGQHEAHPVLGDAAHGDPVLLLLRARRSGAGGTAHRNGCAHRHAHACPHAFAHRCAYAHAHTYPRSHADAHTGPSEELADSLVALLRNKKFI